MFRALSIAALFTLGALLPGQQDAAAQRAAQAIAAYEAAKAEASAGAQRRRTLQWLGEVDHASVTEFLRRELAAVPARDTVSVLEAIAAAPRPELHDVLLPRLQADGPVAVRRAAAVAIARSGDRGVDQLLAIVRPGGADGDGGERARDAALRALVQHGGERAHRGLAPLLETGPMQDRRALLVRLDSVHGVAPISLARLHLVADGDLPTAALAWRQLAEEGHPRARALAIDVLERCLETPPAAVAADLVRGIVLVQDEELFPALLRFGSIQGEAVRAALRASAAAAAKDRKLVDWLIRSGLDSDQPALREIAQTLLTEAPGDAVRPLLEKVRKELRGGGKAALDRAIALHPLLRRDAAWAKDLRALAESARPEARLVGLSLLLDLGSDVAVLAAQKSLGHDDWQLRSIAFRYLARCRDVASVPLLIDRVEREHGRLAHELGAALFAHTGTRCFSRHEWQRWWEANKSGFVLPPAETVRGGVEASAGVTVAYHGIPLVSERIAFLVDVSGSMKERLGTDRKRTRLDGAKEELVKVFTALAEQHQCNLIAYDSAVQPVWDRLRRVDTGNRQALLDAVGKLTYGTATNIFDALEAAFADTEVDTIYLLTDGEPTAGRLVAIDDILDEVRRWILRRQVVVHTIGLGVDSRLLRELAAMSGGEHRRVD